MQDVKPEYKASNVKTNMPEKLERRFTKLNTSHSTIFKELGREIHGTPSMMKPEIVDKCKAVGKWCEFHEDYEHLTNNCLSLRARVDERIKKGELSKYKKNQAPDALVILKVPKPVKYINSVFTRVDVVTKS